MKWLRIKWEKCGYTHCREIKERLPSDNRLIRVMRLYRARNLHATFGCVQQGDSSDTERWVPITLLQSI